MTVPNDAEVVDEAGELVDYPPEETTDSYFVMIPLWILDRASGEAIKLYGVLSTYLNSTSRIVWPSRQTLADRLGKSRPESIDRYLTELSDLGALKIIKRYRPDGGQTSNAYRIVRTPPRGLQGTPPLKTAEAPPLKTAHKPRSILNLEERDLPPVGLSSEAADINTSSTPVDNSEAEAETLFDEYELVSALAKIEANPFDEFWRVYPRKDDKKRARAAFDKALREAPLPEILAGALRYATDPNRDPKYTKQPATWLNAGAWSNGPLPDRAGGSSRPNLDQKLAATAALSGSMVDSWARMYGGAPGQLALDSTRN
ncbi:helix-turn-helix DNA binding domain protein [Arthrobacter phage Altadena]|uniref:Helix-turn-helix DNA binding domain protein n=1 Tax=Arthrobacter phage Altadena TaxID=3059064 RepID=A0AA96KK09_9CAUD|nr:helix-turn-helix DNA binding domain protein [Arthrobacter phage Altadena]